MGKRKHPYIARNVRGGYRRSSILTPRATDNSFQVSNEPPDFPVSNNERKGWDKPVNLDSSPWLIDRDSRISRTRLKNPSVSLSRFFISNPYHKRDKRARGMLKSEAR